MPPDNLLQLLLPVNQPPRQLLLSNGLAAVTFIETSFQAVPARPVKFEELEHVVPLRAVSDVSRIIKIICAKLFSFEFL